jgi:hypothetical protein
MQPKNRVQLITVATTFLNKLVKIAMTDQNEHIVNNLALVNL